MEAIKIPRRSFFAALGAGLAIGIVPSVARADEPSGNNGPGPHPANKAAEAETKGFDPNVMVHIALDGTTTIMCHRSEMGQGVRSSVPLLIADELGADPARVHVHQAPGDKKYGDQNTDGSSSIRKQYEQIRQAGAAARMMLCEAAAKRWGVKPDTCTAAKHHVVHPPSKRTLPFEELVAAAAKLPVPKKEAIVLRPLSELVNVGAEKVPLLDGDAYVTGTAVFGADVKLPGLLVAVIARPAVVGGTVRRHDDRRARAVPGVKRVVVMPNAKPPWRFQPWGGLAVVAENTWAAMKGRAALSVDWDRGAEADFSSTKQHADMLTSVRGNGTRFREKGDIEAAFGRAKKVVDAEYVVPHLSHMQMEPLVATARFENGRLEIWAPTQDPQGARKEVAKILGIAEDAVTVHVTLLGGGFGRKSKADFVAEAAFLAKEMGAPVRVQWTREDDVKHGYYNAANAQKLRAAVDENGALLAWHHKTALTPIGNTMSGDVDTPSEKDLQQGVLDVALSAPNIRVEACKARPRVRVGWYRSVYNIFHAFAVGSFIDELAHARGADPRDTWLDVIGPARICSLADLGIGNLANYGEPLERHPVDAGRLRNVIERVTDAAGWKDRKAKGKTLGLAAHRSFVSYVGVVLSVVADAERKFRIDEAWIAMDAGTVVNKDRVRAQCEGAVVMGISNALYGGISMNGGVTEQTNFRDARVARIRDVPRRIHVDLVPSTAPPSGVGEPGVPPVGAALANAIFALNGMRIREIPIARALAI